MKKILSKSLSHEGARVQRGYYVWARRGPWSTSLTHSWSMDDELPASWPEICADETVDEAALFHSSQRHKPHNKRRILASYAKQTSVGVA